MAQYAMPTVGGALTAWAGKIALCRGLAAQGASWNPEYRARIRRADFSNDQGVDQNMFRMDGEDMEAGTRFRKRLCGSTALSALLRTVPAVLIALSFAGAAHAENDWTGGDGNWSDAGKWSQSRVPDNDPVGNFDDPTRIGTGTAGTVTVDADAAAGRLQVGGGGTLNVLGGHTLSTTNLSTVGLSGLGTGIGTMVVGGTWDAGSTGVRVGNGAGGTLTISNGGALTMANGLLSVGLNAGGDGTLNIDGGSVTNSVAALRVGYNGSTGTVTLTNGGTLSTSNLNLIGDANTAGAGTGAVTISGAGSKWTITSGTPTGYGNLVIGRGTGANGSLTVSGGGAFDYQNNAGTVWVGMNDVANDGHGGGTGSVIVTGAGSLLNSESGVVLGQGAGSSGSALIEKGATLTVQSAGSLLVGRGGEGSLTVSSGGTVNADSYMAVADGSKGSVTVSGAGSSLTVAGGAINVGIHGGDGTLTVSDGGHVTAGTYMTIGQGTKGAATIDGAGSLLTVTTGNIALGVFDGADAIMTISNGGMVTVADGAVMVGDGTVATPGHASGVLTLSKGGQLNARDMLLGSNAPEGSGTLAMSGGAKVNLTGGMEVGWNGGTGVVTLTGQGTRLESAGQIVLGHDPDGSTPTSGTLTVADGAGVKASRIVIGFASGSGTLNIGAGGAAGTIDDGTAIILGGASSVVNFNHDEANYVFANAINDWPNVGPINGAVNFLGTGTTTLTAVSDYSVATNINAGRLELAEGSSIANSSLTTVARGATLSGAGAAGNVTVANGATIAPTAGKTLTVKDLTLQSGSTYLVGIDAQGQNGKILATGTADLQSGAIVAPVVNNAFTIANGAHYALVDATGAATVGAVNTTSGSAMLSWSVLRGDDARLGLDASSIYLVADKKEVASLVSGSSAKGVAAALDSLSTSSDAGTQALLTTLSNLPTQAEVDRAVNQLTPRTALVAAATTGSMAATTAHVNVINTHAAEMRFAQAGGATGVATGDSPRGLGVWMQGLGYGGSQDQRKGQDGYDATTGGVAVGGDVQVADPLRVGAAFSYARTNVDAKNNSAGSNLDIDSYQGALYANYTGSPWYVDTTLVYGRHQYDGSRVIGFLGSRAKGSYEGDQYTAAVEGGYPLAFGKTVVTPNASLAYSLLKQDGYTETGAPGANLSVDEQTSTSLRSGLGVKLAHTFQNNTTLITPEARATWYHEFHDAAPDQTARFAAGGSAFTTTAAKPAGDSAVLGVGLTLTSSDQVSVSARYDAELKDGYVGHNGILQMRVAF